MATGDALLCEIQWIDGRGKPTPDRDPAVARIQCVAAVARAIAKVETAARAHAGVQR